jgi:hypothetical protein
MSEGVHMKTTQAVTWFVAIVTAAAPIYVAYDTLSKGSIPPKKVELWDGFKFNPLTDLAVLGDHIPVKISIGDETIDNLVIANTTIRNVGQAPILPIDYFENLSVSVKEPYKILAVESGPGPVRFSWSRVL